MKAEQKSDSLTLNVFIKKTIGYSAVVLYYALINIHIYEFIDLYAIDAAFKLHSIPLAIFISAIGMYLLMRNFLLYTLCLFYTPYSVKDKRKEKLNYERFRESVVKRNNNLEQRDVNILKMFQSDYKTLAKALENEGHKMCHRCDEIKPLRVHHCSTCKQCVIRMDHHCVWINNCIGLHNHRYFVQLIFHSAISSVFTLFIFYEVSSIPEIFHQLPGSPYIWIGLHVFLSSTFLLYTFYNFWIIYKDITTIDIKELYSDSSRDVIRLERRSFKANLLMIFGTQNIAKALFYPLLNVLPINGLEYEFEYLQKRFTNMKENNDLWSFNQYDN